jgi:hypothetical protein
VIVVGFVIYAAAVLKVPQVFCQGFYKELLKKGE